MSAIQSRLPHDGKESREKKKKPTVANDPTIFAALWIPYRDATVADDAARLCSHARRSRTAGDKHARGTAGHDRGSHASARGTDARHANGCTEVGGADGGCR